ncbi:MAG: hypothetical protein FJ109_18200, partial [Deltaproteobacteria bacterium]|nr:hypothetical protein [Deltaproteobacteria bacterium]
MDRGDVDLTIFEKHLAAEARTALERGGLLSALLGLVGGGAVLALTYSGAVSNVDSAAVFAFAAGFYSVVFYLLARAGRLKGSMLYVAFMPFVSLPTVFFVLSHFQMPAGAATFLTGPISYLYFHLIIMTGFVFDKRLSILAGIVCAIEYQAAYLLARNGLAGITAEDPTLLQDLTSGPLYSIKAIMMVFAGFVVAALSQTVRRVIEKAVREEQQKERISRLFGQYVSPEVKDRIVSEKAEVSGERG